MVLTPHFPIFLLGPGSDGFIVRVKPDSYGFGRKRFSTIENPLVEMPQAVLPNP